MDWGRVPELVWDRDITRAVIVEVDPWQWKPEVQHIVEDERYIVLEDVRTWYICIQGHLTASINRPNTGANWNVFWKTRS